MNPVDRRGLAEIVAWSVSVLTTAVVFVIAMLKGDAVAQHMTGALFATAAGSLLARGTKGAIDRDAAATQAAQKSETAAPGS